MEKIPEDAPEVVLVILDRASDQAVVTRSGGKEARFALAPDLFDDTSAVAQVQWSPAGGLLVVTRAGDHVVFELPDLSEPDRPGTRLVVYLDQRDWSLLARCLHTPNEVTDQDRRAAEQLVEWVAQRRIVLPASAGHYVETTKWTDPAGRYRLGLTVLQHSRGWQMHDPLQVRRDELYTAFRRSLTDDGSNRSPSVFTLRPNALHSAQRGVTPIPSPPGFPQEAAMAHAAVASALAFIDVMLDAEPMEFTPPEAWVGANQRFSDWLDDEQRDSAQKRRSIDVFLLSDLQQDIAEEAYAAGLTPEQMSTWNRRRFPADTAEMPSSGLYRELLHDRHLNRGYRWRPNDLTDMIYLSCAAGYANFVICERSTAAAVVRAQQRLGRPRNTFASLLEAVPKIADRIGS